MGGNTLNKIVFYVVLVALFFSCAPRKELVSHTGETAKAVARAERTRVINEVIQHQVYYTTFSGRAKSQLTMNTGETYDVTTNIRIERDKAIWISVTALMGIEAGRVLITPDSIKMINRLRKEYFAAPFDAVYSYTGNDLGFAGLQSILTGNVIDRAMDRDTEVLALEAAHLLSGNIADGGGVSYEIQLNDSYRPVSVFIENKRQHQHMEAAYGDYQLVSGRLFPAETKLAIVAGKWNVQASMNYSRVTYDEPLEMPFTIPPSYKAIQ